jgi:CRISPR type III-A-associated RAMP protein Csm4
MSHVVRLFRFRFTSPLHIANVRADYDRSEGTIASDTLVPAIMSAWATLGQTAWITSEPSFAFSSLFPYDQVAGKFRYFLPKPAGALTPTHYDGHKLLKKVHYIEASLFSQWARTGQLLAKVTHTAGRFYLPQAPDADEKRKLSQLMTSEVYPRVRVPRTEGGEAEPYYIERIWFAEGCGLYALFAGSQLDYLRVKSALKLLEDEGLGTDRRVGHGQFVLEEADPEKINWLAGFAPVGQATHLVNLSLFCPESPSQLSIMLPPANGHTAHELVKRGGWITSEPYLSLRKRSIHMFREGGIFKQTEGTVQPVGPFYLAGRTVNLAPKWNPPLHPIYRSGKTIFVPVKLN